ncbi:hypothetical protein EYF80_052182 [Liparis tanakae]|uniref:Uncharacterized protein n=1 Tax=Liparis tanakae TaxID=230148 RepID=A0A4Z2F9J9_9TELE|nr:hypothetical protein EYF80_052182 [Liparis tanakae]
MFFLLHHNIYPPASNTDEDNETEAIHRPGGDTEDISENPDRKQVDFPDRVTKAQGFRRVTLRPPPPPPPPLHLLYTSSTPPLHLLYTSSPFHFSDGGSVPGSRLR